MKHYYEIEAKHSLHLDATHTAWQPTAQTVLEWVTKHQKMVLPSKYTYKVTTLLKSDTATGWLQSGEVVTIS